jgi:molecular chaperone HscB
MSNYFEILGAAPRYFVDLASIQNRFYELSRTLHPDRFHNKSPMELAEATKQFAEINKALTTLKSDVDRGHYLFDLAHFKPAQAKGALPPELAEDYFNLQETLLEGSAEEHRQGFENFAKLIRAKLNESDKRREDAFRRWEEAGAPLDQGAFEFFEKAAFELQQRSYLVSMLADLEKKCRT